MLGSAVGIGIIKADIRFVVISLFGLYDGNRGNNGGSNSSNGNDDGVVDADYEVVDN